MRSVFVGAPICLFLDELVDEVALRQSDKYIYNLLFTHICAVDFNAIKLCSLNCVDGRLLEVIYETLDIIDGHFFDFSVSVDIIRWPL